MRFVSHVSLNDDRNEMMEWDLRCRSSSDVGGNCHTPWQSGLLGRRINSRYSESGRSGAPGILCSDFYGTDGLKWLVLPVSILTGPRI